MNFVWCKGGVTAEKISVKMSDAVAGLGLDTTSCRGQNHDGAENMFSKIEGAEAKIRNAYTHKPSIFPIQATAEIYA